MMHPICEVSDICARERTPAWIEMYFGLEEWRGVCKTHAQYFAEPTRRWRRFS